MTPPESPSFSNARDAVPRPSPAGPASPASPPSRSARSPRSPRRGGVLRYVGGVLTLLALVLVGLWAFGKIVSDRWLYSQYIAWIQPWMLLLPALVLLALGLPCRRARRDGSRSRVLRPLHTITSALALAGVLHLALIDLRLYRAPFGRAQRTPATLRIAHWNAVMPDQETWAGSYESVAGAAGGAGGAGGGATGGVGNATLGTRPDVFFLTTSQFADAMEQSAASLKGAGYTLAYNPPFTVWSRYEILYAELIPLGMSRPGGPTEIVPEGGPPASSGTAASGKEGAGGGEAPSDGPRGLDSSIRGPARNWLFRWWNTTGRSLGFPRRRFPQGELGYVMPVTLDTTAVLGRPITVWFIDLPSDPFVFRWEIARFARARFDELTKETNPRTGTALLPPPDLILGDTNIPRGSASLGLLTGPGFEHAFDQCGYGLAATWPRALPLLHLDHTFVGAGLRARAYRLVDPPVSDHWMQVIDVEAR